MLNGIWLSLMLASVVLGVINGTLDQVVSAVPESAKLAFEIILGLVGMIAFWSGMMKIAESSGLTLKLAKCLTPVLSKLFPDVPKDHPAMGAMVMNIAANVLGLANAATPFGLKAMQELQTLNKFPGKATNAMCTFLAINTSSVQLIPATAIAFLAAAGSKDPTAIILTAFLATICSTVVAIVSVKLLEKLPYFRLIPINKEVSLDREGLEKE